MARARFLKSAIHFGLRIADCGLNGGMLAPIGDLWVRTAYTRR